MNRLNPSPFQVVLPVVLVVGATLLGVGRAHAATFTYAYTGVTPATITDNTPAGVNFDINVTDAYTLASFQSISITLTHGWAGDLSATLTKVSTGQTISLFNRVGKSATGTSTFGTLSDFSGTYVFSNTLATGTAARLADASVGSPTALAAGVYRPTTNTFNGNASPTFTGETITNLNTTFDGTNVAGVWRLNVADNASAFTGTVSAVSITLNSPAVVPETGTFALVGLALPVVGFAIRRRKFGR